MVYTANPVNADGTNDYLSLEAALTGAVNSGAMTGQLWFRRTGNDSTDCRIVAGTNSNTTRWHAGFNSGTNTFYIGARDTGNTTVINISTTAAFTSADTDWHHAVWSFDLSDEAKRHLYVDAVSDINVNTYTIDGVAHLACNQNGVFGISSGSNKFAGDAADILIWYGAYIDLSAPANLALFISGGAPVDPATAIATLGTPTIQLSGATDTWHTNDGSGGGYTEVGALTDGGVPLPIDTETAALAPDAILASTNLSGAVAAIQDDPDSPDGNWLTATSATAATDVRVSFPAPGA